MVEMYLQRLSVNINKGGTADYSPFAKAKGVFLCKSSRKTEIRIL